MGRINRYKTNENYRLKSKYNAGIYIRLSVDDGDKDESNSVTNQRLIINDFLKNNEEEINVVDYYIDDGYSGTNFNRPGFIKMLTNIKNNNINTIIVKDLSRFGRNFIEVGNYLEQIFPMYHIRFISINDNIDSQKNPISMNNIITPFKNLMNEEYAKDISRKIRAVKKLKNDLGEYSSRVAPYGYQKSNNQHLIIDPVASEVVKTIYELSLSGVGSSSIVKELNKQGIYSRKEYSDRVIAGTLNDKSVPIKYLWSTAQVMDILRNPTYKGTLILGKWTTRSYKDKRIVKKPKKEWKVIEHDHEAIIDEATWNKVQKAIASRSREIKDKKKTNHLFTGKIYCKECGSKMQYRITTYNENIPIEHRYCLYCPKYLYYDKICTKHKIKVQDLEKIVLKAIKTQINLIVNVENTSTINIKSSAKKKREEAAINLKNIENKIKLIQESKLDVYSKFKKDELDENEYYNEMTNLTNQINDLKKSKENFLNINDTDMTIDTSWTNEFIKYKNIRSLNKKIIDDLIDKIIIDKDLNIEIVFKYRDQYEEIKKYLKGSDT